MIQIRLGKQREIDASTDPLGRSRVGYWPGMTTAEAWEVGRGVWKLKATRVLEEDEVLVLSPEGLVLAAAEITGVSKHDDRQSIQGTLLPNHHLLGQCIEVSESRNPIRYS